MVLLNVRFANALGDAETLGIAPRDFLQLLGWAPDCAEALRALAQLGFLEGDAHGDDLVVAPARMTRTRMPGDRLDDQFHGLQLASCLRSFLVPFWAGRSVRRVSMPRKRAIRPAG
jgi:hypothetical protein